MSSTFTVIPKVTVHPSRVVCYKQVEGWSRREKKIKFDHLLTSDKKTKGLVSDQARRKIGKAVEYLLFMSNDKYLPDTAHGKNYKFKLAFITLTLPSFQVHSDNFIKNEMLNQFFIEAKRHWGIRHYIWRAEKQKNGNIHFHILVDKFVPWSELRDVWNRITNKHGYVDRYRNEMLDFHHGGFKIRTDLLKKWEYKKQVKAYQTGKANDWNSPNSTDVHSLNFVINVKNYICKYITKPEPEMVVEGRMWGCSTSLSNLKGAVDIIDQSLEDEIHLLTKKYPDKVYYAEHFTVIDVDIHLLNKAGCMNLYALFGLFMFEAFNFSIQSIIS